MPQSTSATGQFIVALLYPQCDEILLLWELFFLAIFSRLLTCMSFFATFVDNSFVYLSVRTN
jgi:hypothetical protein